MFHFFGNQLIIKKQAKKTPPKKKKQTKKNKPKKQKQ